MKRILAFISMCCLANCANSILTEEEERVIGPDAATSLSVAEIARQDTLLGKAATRADNLASAYFSAGIKASHTQDALNAGVVLAAGSVAVGALGSASDRALTNRAFAGVGLQTAAQNWVPKTKVESIFKGAGQMNCIAGVAAIHSGAASAIKDSPIAQNLTYAAMQDVRISIRNSFVGEVQTFSNALSAFTDVVQGTPGEEVAVVGADPTPPTDLEKYIKRLAECLK
jgi:hypothetical protein